MANYSDKVIKSLEPENIKKIKAWNKEFTSKFDEDELKTVLRLSESIDKLWKLTADERKRLKKQHMSLLVFMAMKNQGRDHINLLGKRTRFIKNYLSLKKRRMQAHMRV